MNMGLKAWKTNNKMQNNEPTFT